MIFPHRCPLSPVRCLLVLVLAVTCGGVEYLHSKEEIESLPDDIPVDVNKIDLHGNRIQAINNSAFSSFASLSSLRISANIIRNLSSTAFCGTQLNHINLNRNRLGKVPDVSCIWSTLRALLLNANSFDQLYPDDFAGLQLENLQLMRNGFSGDLIALIPLRATLSDLDLRDNNIDHIGNVFANFTSLRTLQLNSNKLREFPDDALVNCTSLEELYLADNRLTQMPNLMSVQSTLMTLDISRNNISKLEESVLNQLPQLSDLSVSYNPLGDLSSIITWDGRFLIESLGLAGLELNITAFQQLDLADFTNITKLDLSHNPLGSFPNLTHLGNTLQDLCLDNVGLHMLSGPDTGALDQLRKLSLADNSLQDWDILEGLLELNQTLQILDLSRNNLSYVHPALFEMYKLQTMDLSGNPLPPCLPEPPNSSTVERITIEHVPLVCDTCFCWAKDGSSGITLEVDTYPCVDPPSLVNQPWGAITPLLLGCYGTTTEEATTVITTESWATSAVVMETTSLCDDVAVTTTSPAIPPFTGPGPTWGPVDPLLPWNRWSQWTECTSSCQSGTRFRIQLMEILEGSNGSALHVLKFNNDLYLGYRFQDEVCNAHPCPLDGSWLHWQSWGACSSTCGTGITSRGRRCLEPQNGGRYCQGKVEEYVFCFSGDCPVSDGSPQSEMKLITPVFTESDTRVSAKSIGTTAILMFVTVFVCILLLDVATFSQHVNFCTKGLRRKRKTVDDVKEEEKEEDPYDPRSDPLRLDFV